jgi:hypothetical protein
MCENVRADRARDHQVLAVPPGAPTTRAASARMRFTVTSF